MGLPRIVLADDHTLVLEAFRKLLEPAFDVVATVSDGRALLKVVPELKPDVVVLEISMPLLNGMDAARQLKEMVPDVKLLFLTVNEDPALVAEAVRVGASGYLLKTSAASELFQTIRWVLDGAPFVSPLVTEQDVGSIHRRPCQMGSSRPLTARQREVLQLLAEGYPARTVAKILDITPRTVAFHKERVKKSLGAKTNAELIQFAIREGLISI